MKLTSYWIISPVNLIFSSCWSKCIIFIIIILTLRLFLRFGNVVLKYYALMRNIFTTLKRYKLCLSDFDELFLVVPLVSCILFSALFQQSLLLLFYSINDVISKVNVDNNTLISLALLAPLLSSQALPIFLLFQEQTLKIEILRNKMSST